jgi:hypothetical protein
MQNADYKNSKLKFHFSVLAKIADFISNTATLRPIT